MKVKIPRAVTPVSPVAREGVAIRRGLLSYLMLSTSQYPEENQRQITAPRMRGRGGRERGRHGFHSFTVFVGIHPSRFRGEPSLRETKIELSDFMRRYRLAEPSSPRETARKDDDPGRTEVKAVKGTRPERQGFLAG